MTEYNNKYGLIIRDKKPSFLSKKPSSTVLKPRLAAFDHDDSSEDEGQKHVNLQIHKEALKKIVKKQTKIEIQKALEQDATVYEYDSIYDDMKSKNAQKTIPQSVQTADKQRKPKYIGRLMKAAQNRSRERQRIEERKIEKERKMEGDKFSDKAQFVTSAYRKRMQEREKEEEEERRMAAIEAAMDVRKQKDLSGFYKHLLRQQVGEEALPGENSAKESVEEKEVENEEDQDTDMSFSSSSDSEEDIPSQSTKNTEQLSSSESDGYQRLSPDKELSRRTHGSRDSYDSKQRSRRDRHEPERRRRERSRDYNGHKRDRHDRDRKTRPDSRERDRNTRHDSRERNHKKRHRDDRVSRDRSPEKKRDKDSLGELRIPQSSSRKDGQPNPEPSKSDNQVKEAKVSEKFQKRTDTDSAMSARERYLARKKAGLAKRQQLVTDSD